MSFRLTRKQILAARALGSDARHILLFGGARSGKTVLIMRQLIGRALASPGSRHLVVRFRFNHVKTSIVHQTLPTVMDLCYPGVSAYCRLDKSDWYYEFSNGSQIWFGGLDDKERTEKILGQEYASIFFNECSQIPFASRSTAITRLAQKTDRLRIKAYYDCNPPAMGHWTYKLFIEKRVPDSRAGLTNPDDYISFGPMNPTDNADNLPADTLAEFENLPERVKKRFFLGQWADASEGALWTEELLEQSRVTETPDMQRIVVAVDPSGCSGPEDTRSDEIGIVVCGVGTDGKGYVLEDLSGRFGPGEWGKIVVGAFDRHAADAVVAESNYGGAMVAEVIRAASREGGVDRNVPFKEVKASRGKVVRAEPVAALFEQQKVHMAGYFPELESQMCAMTAAGYSGDRSPDRLDACVWGLASLFPGMTRRNDGEFRHVPKVVLAYQNTKTQHRPGPRVVTSRR